MYKTFFNQSQQNFGIEQQTVASSKPALSESGAWANGTGYSPVEIILAISVLIGSLAGLIRVLIPVMMQSGHASMLSGSPSEVLKLNSQNEAKDH
ncbi:hypothetical protein [Leptolyngbya iicbica]|uniref:Uncharacterized protein n=2 Tax=Cyanophyceae TaxID=3028117 RepID=A0A4Q7E621_9CYAN|nr:hypothetical protein [Leptolyngbya sp. LK]RZM75613.1 hypothetical protein DYY88_20120 [Leptolyngbya sp. LK]